MRPVRIPRGGSSRVVGEGRQPKPAQPEQRGERSGRPPRGGGSSRGGLRAARPTDAAGEDKDTRVRQRPAEVVDTSDGRYLKVSAESDSKKVAGKIAQIMRDLQVPPSLLAANAQAINRAIKAVAIAQQYLREEASGPVNLIVQPQFEGTSSRATLTLFKVDSLTPSAGAEVLSVKHESDPYKVAGAIAARLRDQKEVSLRSVGPDSVFHAVEAIYVTRQYVALDKMDIKFSPVFEQMQVDGKESSGIRFNLITKIIGNTLN